MSDRPRHYWKLADLLGFRPLSMGRATTLEIKMNYLAPVTGGDVHAEAWVVSKGGRVAVLQAEVMLGETKLAVATGTFYILSGSHQQTEG